MDLYIYYRARVSDASSVEDAVRILQMQLRTACNQSIAPVLQCGLARRPGQTQDHHTWMEIYRHIPLDFLFSLDALLAQSTLPALIEGGRQTEHFMECLPCA